MKNLIWVIALTAITSLMATSCLTLTNPFEPSPAPSPVPSPSPIPVNIPPVAYIDSVIPSQTVKDQSVSFQGHGTDKDGTVVAYRWSSSFDGDLGTTAAFETSSLSVGDHSISLIVQDNNGDWSEMATTTFKVVEEAPPEEMPPIEDITWELQAYGDAGALSSLLAGTTITAEFKSDEGQVGGSGGCNSYSVEYEIDGSQLTIIPPITSTMMLCFPSARMTQEHDFFELLSAAETYSIHDDELSIYCSGDGELIFTPQ
ncbi:MAG: META domain-containing protein [Dehalococcoidales bacterium]|nr:META domain-containing protein [Dehalococcoidales bacterium]